MSKIAFEAGMKACKAGIKLQEAIASLRPFTPQYDAFVEGYDAVECALSKATIMQINAIRYISKNPRPDSREMAMHLWPDNVGWQRKPKSAHLPIGHCMVATINRYLGSLRRAGLIATSYPAGGIICALTPKAIEILADYDGTLPVTQPELPDIQFFNGDKQDKPIYTQAQVDDLVRQEIIRFALQSADKAVAVYLPEAAKFILERAGLTLKGGTPERALCMTMGISLHDLCVATGLGG